MSNCFLRDISDKLHEHAAGKVTVGEAVASSYGLVSLRTRVMTLTSILWQSVLTSSSLAMSRISSMNMSLCDMSNSSPFDLRALEPRLLDPPRTNCRHHRHSARFSTANPVGPACIFLCDRECMR